MSENQGPPFEPPNPPQPPQPPPGAIEGAPYAPHARRRTPIPTWLVVIYALGAMVGALIFGAVVIVGLIAFACSHH